MVAVGQRVLTDWIVKPERKTFDANNIEELEAYLDDSDRGMLMVPINETSDIVLAADGTLARDGFNLTLLAAHQLCHCLAPGLWDFVAEVSGISPRMHSAIFSRTVAIDVLNKMSKLRFNMKNGLRGRQMLKDLNARRVNCIVGTGYQRLSNKQFYENVDEMMMALTPVVHFNDATVIGGSMSLTYAHNDSNMAFTFGGVTFHGGYYFGNSETGECGVHTAIMLKVGSRPLRCISKPRSLSHTGKDFASRLRQHLGGTLLTARNMELLGDQAEISLSVPLALLGPDRKLDQNRRQHLRHLLVRRHLPQLVAKDAMYNAIYGGTMCDEMPAQVTQAAVESRIGLDLVLGLMRSATTLPIRGRARAERLAFIMLNGKVPIK